MAELADELVGLGCQAGVLDPLRRYIGRPATNSRLYTAPPAVRRSAGLIISRAGQRGARISLPRDHMGSVYDSSDVTPRLQAVLALLMTIPLPLPATFTVAARIDPSTATITAHLAAFAQVSSRDWSSHAYAAGRTAPPISGRYARGTTPRDERQRVCSREMACSASSTKRAQPSSPTPAACPRIVTRSLWAIA